MSQTIYQTQLKAEFKNTVPVQSALGKCIFVIVHILLTYYFKLEIILTT
jgi:hypothetical protein